jgi:septation ring formation regulator EzrA
MQVRHLMGAEQIWLTTKEECLSDKENSQAEKIKKQLKELYNERFQLKRNLQKIEKQIEEMEKNLEDEIIPGRNILIQRLLEPEKLAKLYSTETLKKFPEFQKEIIDRAGGFDNLVIEIERWLEKICDSLKYNNLSFLDCTEPNLYLLDSGYKNAELNVYKELFNVMRKDLSRNLHEEVKNDLYQCFDCLEEEVLRVI